jgi:thiol-disulfide isomerase/thioredoxin
MKSIVIKVTVAMLLLCIIVAESKAQDSLTYKLAYIAVVRDRPGIKIGERVPDLYIDKVVNYKKSTLQFDELKGKPIILQFWHQYCPVCRGEFSKLEKLQEEFGDHVNFLLVTFQSEASVKNFFQEQKKSGKSISIASVVEDTLLRKTFPHDGDPHLVWISKDGTVQAITNHLALSEENLRKWLSNGDIHLPIKNTQFDFDINKPLLVNNNGGTDDAFSYRSLITSFIDSIPTIPLTVNRDSTRTRVFISNSTIDELFKELYIKYDTTTSRYLDLDWLNKRIIIDYQDSSVSANWSKAYQNGFDALNNFQKSHMFTYELILPPSYSEQEALRYAKENLERYFRINSSIEKRTVRCLSLIRIDNNDRLKTKGGPEICRTTNDSIMLCQNNAMWSLVNVLNLNFNMPFVVDETNYHNNIDVRIPYYKNDLQKVRKGLQEYGLDLMPREYKMNMLVLTDQR